MSCEVGLVNGLPVQVQNQREAIQEMAGEHLVREIACSGEMSGFIFFVVDSEPNYKLRHHVRLAGALSELLDETVLVYERHQLEGEWGELMREKALSL